jgi:hypothetical protein
MSNSVNDIPVGLRVPSQIPLDAKVYKLSQADLAYLGPSSNLAYTYFKGMIAYCALEQTRWEWREPKFVGEVGLLPTNFLYPINLIIFGIDYSSKAYNFFQMITSSVPGPTGATGATGPIGPAGVAGPVGPAGLNWQGVWSATGVYVLDDAVSYGGASWFCIDPVGPSATTPNADPTNWALLASQGSPGPMGPQGPPGTGGTGTPTYTEESRNTSTLAIAENPSSTTSKITKTFTRAFVTSLTDNCLGLSDLGKVVGETFVVRNQSTDKNIEVRLINNARLTGLNGFDTVTSFIIPFNTTVRFTLSDTTSGSSKVFIVEIINPLGMDNVMTTETLTSTTNSAPFPFSTKTFAQFPSAFSYALPATPVLGEVRYIKTAFSNCTLYASPNPGVDGANNNFYTPTGNGNTSVPLLAGKSYRCTYIGRFGATFGFWTIEIMNNI